MRFTNSWLRTALAGIFSLGIIACHSTHKEKADDRNGTATFPAKPPPTQTGSNLPRHAYVSEEVKREDEAREREKKQKKAKRQPKEKKKPGEKSKSVDEDYVPRGGFR
ncbi:MAG: hypothetical protein ACXWBM_05205 [Chthoniobacterales bacterium]